MYKNFFFLSRFIGEANIELKGNILTDAFSQDKDKLILSLKAGKSEKFVEICVNPGNPYVMLKSKFRRAKKNSVSFFEPYLPAEIYSVEIALYDRIIKISLNKGSIYFLIRGKYTNVVFISNDSQIHPFKKFVEPAENDLINEIKTLHFTDKYTCPHFLTDENDTPDSIRKKYPFIGKEITNELKFRLESSAKTAEEELTGFIQEIEQSLPAVFFLDKFGILQPAFDCFTSIPFFEKNIFDSTSEALQFYLRKKYYLEDFIDIKKIITRHLKKELEKLAVKLNNLDAVLSKESKETLYNKYGNLLLINLHQIKPHMESVLVEDIYDGSEIEIPLNPSLQPNKNAQRWFEKAKDDKTQHEKAIVRKQITLKEYNKLKLIDSTLENIEDKEKLKTIMKDLKLNPAESNTTTEDLKNKFKRYIIDGKYQVFVGKDSQNNDLLTVKFAKQNDYWFHARSVPGSHVVLRNDNTKENMPKNILKKTAALAAYHSKAKTAGISPVSFCQKKYVVKKKGMEPGKVALLKEDVLLVRPEIPEGCEYISED
jgi:predicted ribosome quality control (RQC) complex YloA/Tae2 family protein